MGQNFLLISSEERGGEADGLGSLLEHSVCNWRNLGIPGIEVVTLRGNNRGSEIPFPRNTQFLLVDVSHQKSVLQNLNRLCYQQGIYRVCKSVQCFYFIFF